ncbi:MAG: ferrous iron transport protein B [Sphingobacteriales bacterium]|nr:ferrous iron transport protein B [Sphingobacteriales bacterium]
MKKQLKVALVGNPNTGKSTLFNLLTGLNQKIANFPGVTVDKKTGISKLIPGQEAQLIDLPGAYSLYPKSKDEAMVLEVLANTTNELHPDVVVFIADATNLKRNLLLFSQVADLKLPTIIALNMMDLAKRGGVHIQVDKLAQKLGVRVVPISARNAEGIDELKQAIADASSLATQTDTIDFSEFLNPSALQELQAELGLKELYEALLLAHQYEQIGFLSAKQKAYIAAWVAANEFKSQDLQAKETIARYNAINEVLFDSVQTDIQPLGESYSNRIDRVLTHKIWGLGIFMLILFTIFQSIFSWSAYPMSLIEDAFVWLGNTAHQLLPAGQLTNLVVDGVLSGLSGVLVFIPQIAILFAFIAILEDTGYMARVTFMMDRIMRKVGLNGKSVVPIIGGLACAVPSIMSARNIENWKDRIITIMVTPLVSCSARLPIYTLLISLVVPDYRIWGILNMQGLALMAMYVISLVSAVLVAWVLKFIIKARERGYFIMELPVYRMPRWKNVGYTMYDKVKAFVFEAGKVIVAISIILWVLASYGPGNRFAVIDQQFANPSYTQQFSPQQVANLKASARLENSYAGVLGKSIEPVIKPLGFDWKIGIALITSFAAREVFVGTMATLYSAQGDGSRTASVRDKMAEARNPDTGELVFTLPVAFSLMIFYAYAMQCMSTLAVVYRETKSWKWPLIQLVYMTAMAYVASFLVYQFLS